MKVIQVNEEALEHYFEKTIKDLAEALKKDEKPMIERVVNYHLQNLKNTIIKG